MEAGIHILWGGSETSEYKELYQSMLNMTDPDQKKRVQDNLRAVIKAGDIDCNIMTKIDRNNVDKDNNELPVEYSDALSALRGFALSDLDAGIVLSAGFNRRLYAYIEQFDDFFPDENNYLKKRII